MMARRSLRRIAIRLDNRLEKKLLPTLRRIDRGSLSSIPKGMVLVPADQILHLFTRRKFRDTPIGKQILRQFKRQEYLSKADKAFLKYAYGIHPKIQARITNQKERDF